jgi:hypothetical protein
MASSSLRRHIHHVDKKLQRRLRLYFLIAAILILIFIFNILRGALQWDFGIIGLLVGVSIGVITSRMYHISWDKDAKRVISRLDLFGIIILILYVALEIFREKIVGYITHDFEVGTIGFAVLAGIMFGRVLGTRGKILKILKEQKVFA